MVGIRRLSNRGAKNQDRGGGGNGGPKEKRQVSKKENKLSNQQAALRHAKKQRFSAPVETATTRANSRMAQECSKDNATGLWNIDGRQQLTNLDPNDEEAMDDETVGIASMVKCKKSDGTKKAARNNDGNDHNNSSRKDDRTKNSQEGKGIHVLSYGLHCVFISALTITNFLHLFYYIQTMIWFRKKDMMMHWPMK